MDTDRFELGPYDLDDIAYPVGLSDRQGTIRYANEALGRLVGWPRERLVGRSWQGLAHPDDLASSIEIMGAMFEGAPPTRRPRKRVIRADGTAIWVDLTFVPLRRDGAVQAIVAFIDDVTDVVIKSQALESTTRRLENALELASDGVFEWDVASGRVTGNSRFKEMLGLSEDAHVPDAVEWQAMIHPEDAERVGLAFDELMTGSGRFAVEYRLLAPRGVLTVLDRAGIVERAEDGRPLRVLGTVTDLTKQRAIEETLRHGQRVDALGRLASGVAHDINNLLTSILGNAHFLGRASPERAEQARGDLDAAVGAAAALTRSLVAFARKHPTAPSRFVVGSHVEDLARLLRRMVEPDAVLVLSIAPGEAQVEMDPAELDQILMNLVVNARDALEGKRGEIEVSVEPAVRTSGSFVCFTVRDHGRGMTDDMKRKIFEPFFTTRPGAGTGLGLATVHDIVERRGGFIEVESSPGAGSTFRVYLRRAEASPIAAERRSDEWVRGHERVIVVDDDALVRSTIGRTLDALGYRVTLFASGRECLAAQAGLGAAELLLTDLVMPDLDGTELVRRLSAERPSLRAIVMSGRGDREEMLEGLPFLAKPFAPAELARTIRRVLDEPRPSDR